MPPGPLEASTPRPLPRQLRQPLLLPTQLQAPGQQTWAMWSTGWACWDLVVRTPPLLLQQLPWPPRLVLWAACPPLQLVWGPWGLGARLLTPLGECAAQKLRQSVSLCNLCACVLLLSLMRLR